jgi:hypothetical protein
MVHKTSTLAGLTVLLGMAISACASTTQRSGFRAGLDGGGSSGGDDSSVENGGGDDGTRIASLPASTKEKPMPTEEETRAANKAVVVCFNLFTFNQVLRPAFPDLSVEMHAEHWGVNTLPSVLALLRGA